MFPRRMEAFLLLALLAHLLLFGLVSVSADPFSLYYHNLQLVTFEDTPAEITPAPPEEPEIPPVINRTFRDMVKEKKILEVLPIPLDNQPRWIVELLDIPKETEPDDARFVSERPSKVDEEVQAENTAREPKKRAQRKKASPKSTEIARKSPTKPKRVTRPKPKPKRVAKPKPKPKPAEPIETAENTLNPNTSPPPPGGVPTEETGNLPLTPGEGEIALKKSPAPKSNELLPTYSELAHIARRDEDPNGIPGDHPSEPGVPGVSEPESIGNDSVPGVAEAPENVIRFVKRRGDITLLNAKSYKYASFVRRVARRMFDRFVIGFRPENYYGANWPRIQKGAYLEAIMNTNGRLVNLRVVRDTGNSNFDSLARNSVSREAWDNNVPEGAECADGFIHFVFMPRVIPDSPVDGPSGRVYSSYVIYAVAGLKECD